MSIGIMAAMQEEIDTLLKELPASSEVVDDGQRTYHSGRLWGTPVVVVFSRWGKVAAATTATHLISEFGVGEILFTGVAGAAQPGLNVGDVVVGARFWQHDIDARPLFPRHEIPLLGRSSFVSFRHVCKNLIRRCRAERGAGWRGEGTWGGRPGGNAVLRLARAEAMSEAAGYRPAAAWARLRSA
jgi:nucleoside phosphorylase